MDRTCSEDKLTPNQEPCSSSSASGHELENYSGHLQSEKSSSMVVESTGFCSDDMGDDDVFEDGASVRLDTCELRAPLCSVEKDSDLDCPSPLSEKCPPLSPVSVSGDACRICHCEGDEESPLITPCRCTGSLHFVHQACLQQWIKSSDTRCCELCKYEFIMETKVKPLRKVATNIQHFPNNQRYSNSALNRTSSQKFALWALSENKVQLYRHEEFNSG
ncbi:UNVERIFIED_CONTAM: hypothetical protein K2H54_018791 [Gekko kuhli]